MRAKLDAFFRKPPEIRQRKNLKTARIREQRAIPGRKPVQPLPGNPGPRYPDLLREAKIEGEVLAQFVVGPDGEADMSTFKVLKSTHDLFTVAVQNALPNMKFSAPEVGGKGVKQLVQMPFQFSLTKEP